MVIKHRIIIGMHRNDKNEPGDAKQHDQGAYAMVTRSGQDRAGGTLDGSDRGVCAAVPIAFLCTSTPTSSQLFVGKTF